MKSLGVSLLAFAFLAMFATNAMAGNSIVGTVTRDQHPAKAVVAAVVYDPVSFSLDSDHAIVRLTDAQGRFELPRPAGPYLLVATDGDRYQVVDAAEDPGTTLALQAQPDMVLFAGTPHCYCSRLFWNLYYNQFWDDSGIRWWTITNGCGCFCR